MTRPARLRSQIAAFTLTRTALNTGWRMVYPFLPTLARSVGVSLETMALAVTARSALSAISPVMGAVGDARGRKVTMLAGLAMFSAGLLLVDMPSGPSSHDGVGVARRTLATRRVGHAGTLDPFATGLLVVLVGAGTRLARYLVGLPKLYEGVLRLGVTTASDDATGAVIATSDAWRALDDARVAAAMAGLTGERDQVPPSFSAKRTGGERAHRLARRGVPVTLAPQRGRVHRFALEARTGGDGVARCGRCAGADRRP